MSARNSPPAPGPSGPSSRPLQSGTSSPLPQRVAHSSAAFLHHLHNDPSSHHITLSGGSSRSASAPSRSPQNIAVPLEPTVEGASSSPRPLPLSSKLAGTVSDAEGSGQGGPSTSPLGQGLLARSGSRRSRRPATAPMRAWGDDMGNTPSPDIDASNRLEDPPMPASPGWPLEHLPNEGDPCINEFMEEQDGGVSSALDNLHMAGGGSERSEGGTRLIGRAGSAREGHVEQSQSRAGTSASASIRTPEVVAPSWKTFSRSYAHGLFDPHRIPNPPKSAESPANTTGNQSTQSSPGQAHPPLQHHVSAAPRAPTTGSTTSHGSFSSKGHSSDSNTTFTSASSSSGGTSTSASSAPPFTAAGTQAPMSQGSMAAALAARKKTFELENVEHGGGGSASQGGNLRPDQLALPSYSLAAATVRMASSTMTESDFAPLGRPSPDRELTDPLSNLNSSDALPTSSSDPGSARLSISRSMSTSQHPGVRETFRLPTIAASPMGTPLEHPAHVSKGKAKSGVVLESEALSPSRGGRGGLPMHRIPPATAPLEKTLEAETTNDYFGSASPHFDRQQSYTSQSSSSHTATGSQTTPMGRARNSPQKGASASGTPEMPIMDLPPSVVQPEDIGPFYEKHGWLPAPLPPDEEGRRRALYRFNILHTAPDANFDRIAHMAKLVFNTKIVLIALIDGAMQWHKSETGLGTLDADRISSFCSHTLLVNNDEPFVILDTHQDWRFANAPNVVNPPHIRFYAGAPLRTSEGYNLGSLCVIDDKPRAEFPPRSRLILKEFAAVCMREMELWRDKLQLRVRDKIQTSMERFTRECLEMDAKSSASNAEAAAKMDQVYTRAAQLVCQTVDLEGCFILDISQFESTEVETPGGTKRSLFRSDPYEAESPVLERNDTFGPVSSFPVLANTSMDTSTRNLTAGEHERFSDFLSNNRDGRIFENVAPSWIRYMFPPELRFGMVVPVFGINQQPFALIAAYTCRKAKQYLEGYELQFLRAIGVIILSAVLRRRMVLADKTKSILISSVSHELRTPLHGILAAAELLSDTPLDPTQSSFLKTVQTCGNSLIETVNHVLDFTKLSGSTSSGAPGGSIKLAKVNLATLVEQTVESCWIGQRARYFMGDSDIGSFYAPPTAPTLVPAKDRPAIARTLPHVETVIDIAQRDKGWMVRCEKGGLRRVLMNLVGNSLKFTQDGYVQVTLRELPHAVGTKRIPVEMAVIDTGKGIGKDFLKDQLFHPFSQENPLQTGTGLGLAIVNSIVRSPAVDGKVDVWSSEGMGTEIRVSFDVEVIDEEDETRSESSHTSSNASQGFGSGYSVQMTRFAEGSRGAALSLDVLGVYAASWNFELREIGADICVINEDELALTAKVHERIPVIYLCAHVTQDLAGIKNEMNRSGGFCQILYKPIGPSSLRRALHAAIDWLEKRDKAAGKRPKAVRIESQDLGSDDLNRPTISRETSDASTISTLTEISHTGSQESDKSGSTVSSLSHHRRFPSVERAPLVRRRSEENEQTPSVRPTMAPRGVTYHTTPHHQPSKPPMPRRQSEISEEETGESPGPGSPVSSVSTISTISLADGGVMLKAATLPPTAPRPARVPRIMVVEDNVINRRVLGAFLKKKGFEWAEAVDGKAGLELFEDTPSNYWDVILMDISMPVMNGHEATQAIRRVESRRRHGSQPTDIPPTPSITSEGGVLIPPPPIVRTRAKIFALTGLATPEDKREAFKSGVDGYLVKPVSLASLDMIFKKIGF